MTFGIRDLGFWISEFASVGVRSVHQTLDFSSSCTDFRVRVLGRSLGAEVGFWIADFGLRILLGMSLGTDFGLRILGMSLDADFGLWVIPERTSDP